jgi:ferric-dicitrate binding protein FerR (iron transport regulator)
MTKNFKQVEDIMEDQDFLAWHFKESDKAVNEWEQWLEDNREQQPLVEEAIYLMRHLPTQLSAVEEVKTEQQLRKLNERINELETTVVPMRSSRRRWWMSAAAAVLLAGAGFIFYSSLQHKKTQVNTTYGELRSNQLPDGSTMILNANSKAELSSGWEEGKDREVWLDGEAFFKVKKTASRNRFIVHTGQLDVIVTGTQFNVMHRNNKTTVLLTEGSVLIQTPDGKTLSMKPGDFIALEDKVVERQTVHEDDVLAWKENRLSFNATPLKDVANIITDHYGIKVTMEDEKVGSTLINGIMPNDNLDVLLKGIEEMGANVRIRRNTKEIIFSINQ